MTKHCIIIIAYLDDIILFKKKKKPQVGVGKMYKLSLEIGRVLNVKKKP